ncbi:MAG TPA: TPM domain-containing protein [Bacteroidales bacterium]|nr:TPM domain-containing protein [Bacteroidales bacterium]
MKFLMTYRNRNSYMKPGPLRYFFLILLFSCGAMAASQILPEKPYPPRLVNDYAGMLDLNGISALERKLVAFDDSTSTQIAIVTLEDLGGYDINDYGQRLAEKWGIGQQSYDNGVLVLVKAKTGSGRGEVAILPGYGLEGAIPDILCAQIIDYEILPEFRKGNYYEGLNKAADALMALARGDFPPDKYENKNDAGAIIPLIIFIIVLVIILSMRSGGGKNQRHISDKGLPLWLLMSMMNSGRNSHSGSWGGFSGGGGSRSGGGFGGFGGGSFGGGGASGSW